MSPRRRKSVGRLPRWHEWALYFSFAVLALSGVGWLLLDDFVRVQGPFGPVIHPAEPWLLRLHGVATYAFLIVAGALIPVHIQAAWKARRNRTSGGAAVAAMLLLAVTGVGLYYVSDDVVRHAASLSHWLLGLAAAVLLPIHILLGRASR